MFISEIIKKIPTGLLSIVILGLIAYVSLDGDPFDAHQIKLFEDADKVIHAVMYLTLASVFMFDYIKYKRADVSGIKALVMCAALAFAYSALMEYFQGIMGLGRSSSAGDLVANFTGVCLGVIFMKCFFMAWICGILKSEDVK